MIMDELTAAERMEIVVAEYDGDGWVLDRNTPGALADQMHRKGLIRYWRDRWQLTPKGFAHHPEFDKQR